MKRMRSITLLVLTVCLVVGCKSLSGDRYASPPTTGNAFKAGAAEVELTPPPGFPLAGWSLSGKESMGVWARLYARAVYLEGENGEPVVFVISDLWAMPGGVADRAAEIARKEYGVPLGRGQFVIAATHTHHGPGNYATSPVYNVLGSSRAFVVPEAIEFIARRIAHAVRTAYESRTPATLGWSVARLDGIAVNRSMPAFLANPESREIIRRNNDQPSSACRTIATDPRAGSAVNPDVTVLTIRRRTDAGLLSVLAFAALHPTVGGSELSLYSSDIFGIATRLAADHLASGGSTPVVALFNGAEGDVSSNWDEHDRANAMRLGGGIAHTILKGVERAQPIASTAITWGYHEVEMRGQKVLVEEEGVQRTETTEERARIGIAMIGGAEDGRTAFSALGADEGAVTIADVPIESAGDLLKSLRHAGTIQLTSFEDARQLSMIGRLGYGVPHVVPIGVYRIGPIAFATVPGEASVTLGDRIQHRLATALPGVTQTVVVGLANEYLSYFTTPEEFRKQHYEGASTLYGRYSGSYLVDELAALAGTIASPGAFDLPLEYRYDLGPSTSIETDGDWEPVAGPLDGLRSFLHQPDVALERFPRFRWYQNNPTRLDSVGAQGCGTTPRVELQAFDGGAWKTIEYDVSPIIGTTKIRLRETDQGLNIVSYVVRAANGASLWESIWIVPPELRTVSARWRVTTPGCAIVTSESFQVAEVLGGCESAVSDVATIE